MLPLNYTIYICNAVLANCTDSGLQTKTDVEMAIKGLVQPLQMLACRQKLIFQIR